MNFYRKQLKLPKTKTVTAALTGGAFLGCYERGGRLEKGLAAEKIYGGDMPSGVRRAFYSACERCLFIDNGGIYRYELTADALKSAGGVYYDPPWFIESLAEDGARVYYGTQRAGVCVAGGESSAITFPQSLADGLYHCGRFFFCGYTDGYAVFWTGTGGAEDWEESVSGSGYLRLEDRSKGAISRLLPCGDDVILVRKTGITVLHALGDPENFRVESAGFDTGEIYAETAASDGERVCFATAEGLFAFDGKTLSEIGVGIYGYLSPTGACLADKKYFVAAYYPSVSKNAVLCVDVLSGGKYLVDLPATALCAGDRVYAFASDGLYAIATPTVSSCEWRASADFGGAGRKTLRRIAVSGGGEGTVTVGCGNAERTFALSPCVRADLRGETFSFRFRGDLAGAAVRLTAEVAE